MTSSSASGSTCSVLYGSIRSDIRRTHPDRRQRGGQRLGLLGRQPAEQVANDVAEGGRDRKRKDRAEEAGQRPADDDGEDDRSRMEADGVALDLGDQEVVLDLLDQEVQADGGHDGGRTS